MASLFSSIGNSLFGVPQPSSQPYADQAAQLQQQAQQYAGREQSDYDAQAALAARLNGIATGSAPSAADMQLTQDFGQNLKNGLAMGAGSSGANSVLARYLASQATGTNGAALAQAAGLQKAKEATAANQQLGGIYSGMEGASAGLYGTDTSTGLNYNQLANNVNQANSTRDQTAENELLGAAGGVAGGLGGLGAMYFKNSGGGSGGGSPAYSVGGNNTSFWSNPVNSAYRSAFGGSSNAGP